jgi:hypothetical protein
MPDTAKLLVWTMVGCTMNYLRTYISLLSAELWTVNWSAQRRGQSSDQDHEVGHHWVDKRIRGVDELCQCEYCALSLRALHNLRYHNAVDKSSQMCAVLRGVLLCACRAAVRPHLRLFTTVLIASQSSPPIRSHFPPYSSISPPWFRLLRN